MVQMDLDGIRWRRWIQMELDGNSTPPAPHGRTCVIERGNGGHAVRAAFPRAGDVPVSPPGRRAAPCPSSVIGVVRRPPVGKRDWVAKGDHANHTVQNKNRPPNPIKMELMILDGVRWS